MNELYEPMIARDIDAIPGAVSNFRSNHTSQELFQAVTRFAVLAASPSQHGKHSLLACVAAKETEQVMGDRYDELLTECAIYTAQSRLPWSEPPITDPPPFEQGQPVTLEEIRAAITERDRLRGERWLAARLERGDIAHDFFSIAAEDLCDFGHKLIVAVGVWKLSLMLGQPQAYGFLRVAVGEWTAYGEGRPPSAARAGGRGRPPLHASSLIDDFVASEGSLESFHSLVLFDAATQAAEYAGDQTIADGVISSLAAEFLPRSSLITHPYDTELPIYRLARDYAEYLKAFPMAERLGRRDEILAAAKYNRDHAASFEEWSFA